MTQIIPSDFDIAAEESAEFVPMRGVANPHLQTMLPRLIRRKVQFTPHWQRLDLPDGDFLDLAWSEDPDRARHKPRLVVFHGLEGSLHSPYAHGLINAARARGWLGVVMHFRGCSGEPNRQKRIYHSGETEDGTWFLHWLRENYGTVPTAAVGYSLGGTLAQGIAARLEAEGETVAFLGLLDTWPPETQNWAEKEANGLDPAVLAEIERERQAFIAAQQGQGSSALFNAIEGNYADAVRLLTTAHSSRFDGKATLFVAERTRTMDPQVAWSPWVNELEVYSQDCAHVDIISPQAFEKIGPVLQKMLGE